MVRPVTSTPTSFVFNFHPLTVSFDSSTYSGDGGLLLLLVSETIRRQATPIGEILGAIKG